MPGSPFMVMIFDTQEELSRFLQVKQNLCLLITYLCMSVYIDNFFKFFQQGGYSPTGQFSEMYGSIGGHYSSHYGNLNYSSGAPPPFHPPPASVPWRGSQNFIH